MNKTENRDGWTDERVELLKRGFADGLSASLNAKQIGGVSRNAVIGKLHRLGLRRPEPAKPATFKPYPQRKAEVARRGEAPGRIAYGASKQPKQQYQERPQAASGPIDSPNAKVWTERHRFQCAYIVEGAGADAVSCCNKTGGAYCAGHTAIMYAPTEKRRDSSACNSFGGGDRTQIYVPVDAGGNRLPARVREPRTFEEWAAA